MREPKVMISQTRELLHPWRQNIIYLLNQSNLKKVGLYEAASKDHPNRQLKELNEAVRP